LPTGTRVIKTNDPEANKVKANKFSNNSVSTARYNLITFIPKNLIEQFCRLANIYFLIISILQLATPFSPTGKVGTVIPLVLVVLFQMLKDGLEDLQRHIADRQVNYAKTRVLRNGELVPVRWKDVV
jgi:phospholipid-transporting ATPase